MNDTSRPVATEIRPVKTVGGRADDVLAEVQLDTPVISTSVAQGASTGVPIPRGRLHPEDPVAWRDDRGAVSGCQSRPLAVWPDGSVRWLHCDWAGIGSTAGPQRLELIAGAADFAGRVVVRKAKSRRTLDSGLIQLHGDPTQESPISIKAGLSTRVDSIRFQLHRASESPVPVRIDEIEVLDSGPLRTELAVRGQFPGTPLNLQAHFRLRAGSESVELEVSIHHGGPAAHRGGCWDLGDRNSVAIEKLTVDFCLPSTPENYRYSLDGGGSFALAGAVPLELHQASSGGRRWDSANHQDGSGRIPMPFRGYRLSVDGAVVREGDRATPWFSAAQSARTWTSVGVRKFWQNFPLTLRTTERGLSLDLLSAPKGAPIEFQGGERKTYELALSCSADPDALQVLSQPATLRVFPHSVASAQVLPHFLRKRPTAEWGEWIRGIVAGDGNFFDKRDAVDEYGWRHFGELFADHEAIHSDPDRPLASHYNNQYDPLLSFLRQYLETGNRRWFELADDLARHVRDIDIYNTEQDREEYNGAMFWHTDHYLDAGTCTHRSYSRAHAEIKGAAGGGPSLEHCYAQGLAQHYLLTGDRNSKRAVLQLADWVLRVNRGPSTVLGSLHQLRRHRGTLKQWLRGAAPTHYRCPFNRATGNSLHTMLDAHLVTADSKYLVEASWLIRHCAGPADDPVARDLLNAEANWSYTVFLEALGRYLGVLEQSGDLDNDHAYCAATLCRYADWMIDHEINYLDRRELLEFPNETWPAQDLRKARVLLHACNYLPVARAAAARDKAFHLFDTAIDQLKTFPEEKRALTRPMVLLLQNYEMVELWRDSELPTHPTAIPEIRLRPPSFGSYLREQFGYAIRQTSPAKEFRWLQMRIAHARS